MLLLNHVLYISLSIGQIKCTLTKFTYNFAPWIGLIDLKTYLLDQGPFCGATDYSYFGLRVPLPMGFKARVVLSTALILSCAQ